MGAYCSSCGGGHSKGECQRGRFQWGFGGENRCYLMGRLDGVDLTPLDLCGWLYCNETDTTMTLVPDGADSYIQYSSERDISGCNGDKTEPDRIYICDLLSLGSLNCLGDVAAEEPKSCDILVYDPCSGDDECEACIGSDNVKKWTAYTIPDAGDCEVEADEDGFYKVLTKNEHGCIVECRVRELGDTYQYVLRDSVPDDPDWPFTYGNFTENIPLLLSTHVPRLFGKSDLEVRIEYGYGTGHPDGSPVVNMKSIVIPTQAGGISDWVNNAIVIQGTTAMPWGTFEGQASRTVLVPKGRELNLAHTVEVRSQSSVPNKYTTPNDGGTYAGVGQAATNFSRLHALTITVRATRGHRD